MARQTLPSTECSLEAHHSTTIPALKIVCLTLLQSLPHCCTLLFLLAGHVVHQMTD